jgi:hypothetical protein
MEDLIRLLFFVLALGCSSTTALSTSRSAMPVEDAAREMRTDTLVTNIVSLFLFEEHCLPRPGFEPVILKAAVNKFAALGEARVGRQVFRTLIVDDLSRRRLALRGADVGMWCHQLAPELAASGIGRPPVPNGD